MRISLDPVRKKEVSMVVAIIFILVFVLLVISTHGEAASPTFTATRSISPDDIAPGSTFKVQVTLNQNLNQKETDFELDETVPTDLTVVSADSAGAIFNASDLKWAWKSVSAGETKTVSYDVVVPSNSTEKSYRISGVITASNATATDVGGELTVAVKTPSRKTPDWLIGTAIVMLILIFVLILCLGWLDDHKLDKGEMRRALAGMLVVGFTVLAVLSIIYEFELSMIALAYIELTGIVVGFYFGAKTAAEKRAEAAAEITIENVRFPFEKVAITIRNGGDSKITVDRIYINKKAFDIKNVTIGPEKFVEVPQPYEWDPKTEYKIKVATATGLTAETTLLSPAITIDQVKFDEKQEEIKLTVRSGENTEIKEICVNGEAVKMETVKMENDKKIVALKPTEITIDYKWDSKTEYKIKIATTTELTDEITAVAQKGATITRE